MSEEAVKQSKDTLKLQHTFVAMLFALAAGYVATSAADVFSLMRDIGEVSKFLPAISHVALSLLVITMSWIEWSRAVEATSEKDHLNTIVEGRFFMLLLDVALVVLYFLLAREIEVRQVFLRSEHGYGPEIILADPTAAPEIKWCFWILTGYFIYDFVVDVVLNPRPKRLIKNAIVGCFSSLISLALVWFVIRKYACPTPTAYSVMWTDLALIAVFALFRLLKGLEYPVALLLGADASYFRKRNEFRMITLGVWIVIILVAFVGFFFCGTQHAGAATQASLP